MTRREAILASTGALLRPESCVTTRAWGISKTVHGASVGRWFFVHFEHNYYRVTHKPTGCLLASFFEERTARELIRLIEPLTDWGRVTRESAKANKGLKTAFDNVRDRLEDAEMMRAFPQIGAADAR